MTTIPNESAIAPVANNPLAMIERAVELKADPDQLGKLMDLQERWEKRNATAAYNSAMVAVQGDLPRVCSDARNTQTNSEYPTETRVRQTIQKKCLEHGFTFVVDEAAPPQDDVLCVRLTIRHVDGHETTMLRYGKVDMYGPKGNPNSTHVQGCQKTATYLGRRMLLQAFGVVVDGDDLDGNGQPKAINDEQVKHLERLIQDTDSDRDKFLAVFQVNDMFELPDDRYDQALKMLEAKKRKQAKAEQS
jgi:hypothetical protein